jgi:hypothetical protein
LDFLALAGWRSKIETMALLYPKSTICLWVEFPAQQQLGGLKKLQRSIEQTQYITPTLYRCQALNLL